MPLLLYASLVLFMPLRCRTSAPKVLLVGAQARQAPPPRMVPRADGHLLMVSHPGQGVASDACCSTTVGVLLLAGAPGSPGMGVAGQGSSSTCHKRHSKGGGRERGGLATR